MIWMPINSAPGYSASDMGDIMSPKGLLLRQQYSSGRLRVRIRGKRRTVWHLVLEAFAGSGRGYRPKHLNGNPFDNRYENLVYTGRPRREAPPSSPETCRKGHELIGDNVELWGYSRHRICVACRDGQDGEARRPSRQYRRSQHRGRR